MGKIVEKVCSAIYKRLQPKYMTVIIPFNYIFHNFVKFTYIRTRDTFENVFASNAWLHTYVLER